MKLSIKSKLTLNDGHKIPILGFGTYLIQPKEIPKILDEVKINKYRMIDTAQWYNNEYDIGLYIKSKKIKRSKIFITSKVWVSNYKYHALDSIVESMSRLSVKYIDLMLVHWPYKKEFDITVNCYKDLMAARKNGWIKSIGVSNFSISDLKQLHSEVNEWPAVNQFIFSPANQQNKLIEFCREKGIVTEGYSVLKPLFNGVPIAGQLTQKEKDSINRIAKDNNKSSQQIVLRWALQRDMVIFPKSKSPKRIKENTQIFDFELSEKDMSIINKMDKENTKEYIHDTLNKIYKTMNISGTSFKRGLFYDKHSIPLAIMNKGIILKANITQNKFYKQIKNKIKK